MPEDMSSWSLAGIAEVSAAPADTTPRTSPARLDAPPAPSTGQESAPADKPATEARAPERPARTEAAPTEPGDTEESAEAKDAPEAPGNEKPKPWGTDPRFQEDNEAYKAGKALLAQVQAAGYPSIEAYNRAAQEYSQQQARQQEEEAQAQRLQEVERDLVQRRDSGEITPDLAERLYQAEINNLRAEAALAQTQNAQKEIARQLGETRLREVSEALPGFFEAVPDLAPVIRSTGDAQVVQRFAASMKAYIAAQVQSGIDAHEATRASAPAAPPALSRGGAGYQAPPPTGGPDDKFPSLATAMDWLGRGRK